MVVDFHVHIGWVESISRDFKGRVYVDLEDLLAYMDENDIDWAVTLSCPKERGLLSNFISNEDLIHVAEKGDGRIIPFCSIDPRSFNALKRIEKLVELGCRGIGEFKVPLKVDDVRVIRVLEKAEEYGLPLLFHMEEKRYFYDIHSLDKVLDRFRNVKFIAHGPGWWMHITGKVSTELYPKGRIKSEGKIQGLLRKHDNLYADISATSGLNALKRDRVYAKTFLTEFSDKILFGTDFPCLSLDGSQYGPNRAHMKLLESLELPDKILERVLHLNAEKLLSKPER